MEIDNRKLTFIDVFRVDLIRKKILYNLPTLYDFGSLAKTCRSVNYLIYNDVIRKDMFRFFDEQHIFIKYYGERWVPNRGNIDGVEFFADEEFYMELERAQKFNGETIIFKNEINFEITNVLEDISMYNNELFVNKFIKECDFNCDTRKEATNLELRIDDVLANRNNHCLILYIICYMEHPNITRIKIPDTAFMSDSTTYTNLKSSIFNGFPKFHELIICAPRMQSGFRRFMKNKNILENILKELSKKENATLTLECYSEEWNVFVNVVHMIRELSLKYNVKIKCDVGHIIPLQETRRDIVCSTERCILFPIEGLISSFFNYISSFSMFFCTFRNLQYFINLEKMELRLSHFDIIGESKKIRTFNYDILSLKTCNRLKHVKIEFLDELMDDEDINYEAIYSNVKFISSLMPKCVERLELWNVPGMSNDIMKIINENMPIIKILVTWEVTYKDIDCLNILQNLKAYVSYQSISVEIPRTVELLAIGSTNYSENDEMEKKMMYEEILRKHSERFSKRVQSSQGRYIFFNDVRMWSKYKRLFQNNLYFFC
uniref:F-box domain-containing protein n=1 Tax=Strongyloides venezuelensis TaxID=75913 RepID=A0A0K0F2S2_STRVS